MNTVQNRPFSRRESAQAHTKAGRDRRLSMTNRRLSGNAYI